MLYLLLLAILLHVPALGVLGKPCGETVQIHTLTQRSTQAYPVHGIVTQTHWTSLVIHINILTMAAPRENPHRDPEDDPHRDPEEDPPRDPRGTHLVDLSQPLGPYNSLLNTHPLTGRGTPMNNSKPLNKGLKYSWKAHMRTTKNQTR